MRHRVLLTLAAALFSTAQWSSAQALPPIDSTSREAAAIAASDHQEAPDQTPAPPVAAPLVPSPGPAGQVTFGDPKPVNPFTALPRDLKRFFSRDTAAVMGLFIPAASTALPWDQAGMHESQEHLSKSAFKPGNIAGGFAFQASAALGTWAIGRLSGSRITTEVGGDLLRAQVVSQALVQSVKLITRRQRPDNSDVRSFPSGHAASAFATAAVLDRHFGWKVAVPSYGFASYVAMARLSANKHHLSDVIIGAGVGIAAGRTVTMGIGGAKFDLGMAPTQGGAAVTFTKR